MSATCPPGIRVRSARYVRTFIDRRRRFSEYFVFIAVGILIAGFIREPGFQTAVSYVWFAITGVIALELSWTLVTLNRELKERWPDKADRKGALFYGGMRAMQIRKLRVPAPVKKDKAKAAQAEDRGPKGGPGFPDRPSSQPLRLATSSVSWGTTLCRSPTTPKSASSKIGASASLLMTTIVFARLHPCPVLDGAGDAGRDVQLRGDGLAGLSDLELVRVPARVGGGAGGAHGTAELIGQRLDDAEVALPDATAAGHDDGGLGQVRPTALGRNDAVGDLGRLGGVADRGVHRDDGAGAGRRLRRGGVGPDGDDRRARDHLRLHDDRAAEDVLRADAVPRYGDGVGDHAGVGLDGQHARDLLAVGGRGDQHRGRRLLGDQRREHLGRGRIAYSV